MPARYLERLSSLCNIASNQYVLFKNPSEVHGKHEEVVMYISLYLQTIFIHVIYAAGSVRAQLWAKPGMIKY